MLVLRSPDANIEGSSSTPSDAGAQTAQGTQQAASSTAKTGEGESTQTQKSLRDVAQKAFDKATETEAKPEKGGVPEKDTTGEEKEAASTEEGEEKEGVAEGEEKKPETDELPPFHEHPRWKEKVKEVNDLKAKVTEFETQWKAAEPELKDYRGFVDYMNKNAITSQEVNEAMLLLATLKTDPAKAREMLKPVWENLGQFDGSVLPQDLAARVEEGELSEAAAKEIAQLRAGKVTQQRQGEFTQQQQAAQAKRLLGETVSNWDSSKRASDPDFKPKAGANAPDGLYELTARNFAYLGQVQPANNMAEVVRNLDQAYTDAKSLLKRFAPKPAATAKAPTSGKASTATTQEPKTIRDVVAKVAAEHGLNMASA